MGCTVLGPAMYLAPVPPDNCARVLPAVLLTPKSANLAPSGLFFLMAVSSARWSFSNSVSLVSTVRSNVRSSSGVLYA